MGWEWKRAKVVAKDDDPQRGAKLARSRWASEQLQAGVALFFADELDIALLPKVGSQWTPKGEQVQVGFPTVSGEIKRLEDLGVTDLCGYVFQVDYDAFECTVDFLGSLT